jgi:hypothetical protein
LYHNAYILKNHVWFHTTLECDGWLKF